MRIGILSVQGAFLEHEAMLKSLGAQCFQIRQKKDLADGPPDGLVLPGGESTVMHKLLLELELYEPLKEMLENGLPVLATCAGLILLARKKRGWRHRLLRHTPRHCPQKCLRKTAGKLPYRRGL